MMPKMHEDGSIQFGSTVEEAERVASSMVPHCMAILKCLQASAPNDQIMHISTLLSCAGLLLSSRANGLQRAPDDRAIALADTMVAQEGPLYIGSLLTRLAVTVPQMCSYAETMEETRKAMDGIA